jgi:hypothetical protein
MDMSADRLRKICGERKGPVAEVAMLDFVIVINEEETRCAP